MSVVNELPFMSHLIELRDRLLRMVLAVLVLLIALFPFANDIYTFIADPLMAVLPDNTSMIATQVASPFLTPFKLSLVSAIFFAMPYLLYQFWAFLAPGLYKNEKRLALPILISSILLFYLGTAFAYFVVFPLVFAFLTGVAPEGVAVMTDISHYLDFVLTLFFAFGLSFEVPVATILLVLMGITTPDELANKRPYVIVSAFIFGMLLTPPDVISQTLLAVPVWLLFEVGVLFARLLAKKTNQEENSIMPEAAAAVAGGTAGTGAAASNVSGMSSGAASTSESNPDLSDEASYEDQDNNENDFKPMSEAEMDAELDRLEEEDDDDGEDGKKTDSNNNVQAKADNGEEKSGGSAAQEPEPFVPDAVDEKLERVMELREQEEYSRARMLLYEILAEGNENQVKVARNILNQLDS